MAEENDLGLSLDTDEGQSDQQTQQQQPVEPDTQTQSQQQTFIDQYAEAYGKEAVDQFKKNYFDTDGNLDQEKIAKTLFEEQRELGRLKKETGDLRRTLFQSQVQQPQTQQAPPQQQQYTGQRAEGQNYSAFLDPEGILTEGDLKAVAQVAHSVINQDRQTSTYQQQQEAATRFRVLDQSIGYILAGLKRTDNLDPMRESEIENLLSQDTQTVSKINEFIRTGQGYSYSDLENLIHNLNSKAKENVRTKSAQNLGIDPNSIKQFVDAQRQQAAQAGTSPNSGGNANSGGGDDFFKGMSKADRKVFEDFLS